MKFTRWTEQEIRKAAKQSRNARDFHDRFRGAEKAAKRLGILDQLFPEKQVHRSAYSEADIRGLAQPYSKRSQFQRANPSAYNAARTLGIVSTLFPVQLNARVAQDELKRRASHYECRSEFEAGDNKAYQIAQKRGILDEICPPKMQGISIAEKEILAFLQSIASDFQTKRFANDYELDCYSDSLKLGVEYNGLYWHSEENRPRDYHLKKTKYFESRGIRVIHVWEHEWKDRKEQVKDFLRSACGGNAVRIGARKCEFREIGYEEAKEFLSRCHIQGHCKQTTYAIGCFYEGELVGVCSFGRHHRDSSKYVLNRFACKANYTISGFLAKASKIGAVKLGTIYSWAHYAKSQAKGYIAAGWSVEGFLRPDYFYADAQGRVISKQARKKSAVGTPTGMTEAQHSKADGLYRIWDCGKILLRFKTS